MQPHATPAITESGDVARGFVGAFRFSARALELVWSTSHALTVALGLLTLIAGLLPAGIAIATSSVGFMPPTAASPCASTVGASGSA